LVGLVFLAAVVVGLILQAAVLLAARLSLQMAER
jgi:uncharacterized integral membrane protein